MLDVQFESVLAHQVGLVEETEILRTELRDCLAVLGRAEAAPNKLEVVPNASSPPELLIVVMSNVSFLPEIQVGSVNEEAGIYGDLSLRATSCRLPPPIVPTTSRNEAVVEVVAPLLQIMPELQKYCGDPTLPISMVLPVGDPVAFVGRGGLATTIALSPEVVGQVSFVGVEVDMVGALAPNSEPLKPIRSSIFDCDDMLERIDEAAFAKKLGCLLANLDAAFPGSAKMIVRILAEEVSVGKIKKVKKALRSIGKKSDIIAKASATA
ncbi:hypothetical protein ZWY2020_012286 [Hordeum vulgare]|nr:hypothetical protein ZWY2020_012286 [Hordeum vulgare]